MQMQLQNVSEKDSHQVHTQEDSGAGTKKQSAWAYYDLVKPDPETGVSSEQYILLHEYNNQLNRERAQLEYERDSLQQQLSKYHTAWDHIRAAVESAISERDGERAHYEHLMHSYEQELSRLSQLLESEQSHRSDAEAELRQSQSELSQLRQSYEQLSAQASSLERERDELRSAKEHAEQIAKNSTSRVEEWREAAHRSQDALKANENYSKSCQESYEAWDEALKARELANMERENELEVRAKQLERQQQEVRDWREAELKRIQEKEQQAEEAATCASRERDAVEQKERDLQEHWRVYELQLHELKQKWQEIKGDGGASIELPASDKKEQITNSDRGQHHEHKASRGSDEVNDNTEERHPREVDLGHRKNNVTIDEQQAPTSDPLNKEESAEWHDWFGNKSRDVNGMNALKERRHVVFGNADTVHYEDLYINGSQNNVYDQSAENGGDAPDGDYEEPGQFEETNDDHNVEAIVNIDDDDADSIEPDVEENDFEPGTIDVEERNGEEEEEEEKEEEEDDDEDEEVDIGGEPATTFENQEADAGTAEEDKDAGSSELAAESTSEQINEQTSLQQREDALQVDDGTNAHDAQQGELHIDDEHVQSSHQYGDKHQYNGERMNIADQLRSDRLLAGRGTSEDDTLEQRDADRNIPLSEHVEHGADDVEGNKRYRKRGREAEVDVDAEGRSDDGDATVVSQGSSQKASDDNKIDEQQLAKRRRRRDNEHMSKRRRSPRLAGSAEEGEFNNATNQPKKYDLLETIPERKTSSEKDGDKRSRRAATMQQHQANENSDDDEHRGDNKNIQRKQKRGRSLVHAENEEPIAKRTRRSRSNSRESSGHDDGSEMRDDASSKQSASRERGLGTIAEESWAAKMITSVRNDKKHNNHSNDDRDNDDDAGAGGSKGIDVVSD